MLNGMVETLRRGEKVELRGFGRLVSVDRNISGVSPAHCVLGPRRPSHERRPTIDIRSCTGSRAAFSGRLPCGARSLPFGRPVQTAPALRRQCTAGEHGAGPLAAGATQPGGKPAASQLGRPPSRGVHARLAPSALPARWEARRAIYAPPFPLESPPTLDVVLPMAELTSLADGQSGRGRAFLTRLAQPARPCGFARFPKTRTVPQTDTVPADAPSLEVSKRPPT